MSHENVSGNYISREGTSVVKQYRTGVASYYREHGLLTRLLELQVPRVLPGSRPGELHTEYVNGISGEQTVARGSVKELLFEMGSFLRRLHEVDPASFSGILPGEGNVLVHGDFAHYNCMMEESGEKVAAILDWETAHLGNSIEDVSWCEWQFRNRYPEHTWALNSLFAGFGEQPNWQAREDAVAIRLAHLNSADDRLGTDYLGVMRFEDYGQVSAFVAAFSRYLCSPHGNLSDLGNSPVQVWQRLPIQNRPELLLSPGALHAVAAGFDHVRLHGILSESRTKTERKLLIGGAAILPWGTDEALSQMQAGS